MMEKFGEFVKRSFLNFKLEQCCFVASVRNGAVTLACANVILGLAMLVGLSEGDEGFDPLLLQALNMTTDLAEDGPDFRPYCVIAYATEIASNALVICAMWRNDILLLRAYLYYALGVLTGAVMVYSVVFGALEVIPELLIVASVGTQLYQIMLVRSAMVEIKQASIKNGFTVNLKQNPESGSNEKYTVAIEPETKPVLIKEDISKPVLKEVIAKEITVHSPSKEAFIRKETEVEKPLRIGKEKVKIGEARLEKVVAKDL